MAIDLNDVKLWVESRHGEASIDDMTKIVQSMRFACLHGIKLRSDMHPKSILVENIKGSPSNWAPIVLATERPDKAAWIRVTIDSHHWARLAYQFGHELGHVISNTWGIGSLPQTPCQFLEEVCVEAFSIRGLFEIDKRWNIKPPHPHWKSYAHCFSKYAESTLKSHRRLERHSEINERTISIKFKEDLCKLRKLGPSAKALVPTVAEMLISNKSLIEDFSALNRWPERSSSSIEIYIEKWIASCQSINSPGALPRKIRKALADAEW